MKVLPSSIISTIADSLQCLALPGWGMAISVQGRALGPGIPMVGKSSSFPVFCLLPTEGWVKLNCVAVESGQGWAADLWVRPSGVNIKK